MGDYKLTVKLLVGKLELGELLRRVSGWLWYGPCQGHWFWKGPIPHMFLWNLGVKLQAVAAKIDSKAIHEVLSIRAVYDPLYG